MALSRVAGTPAQAPRGREEAAAAGRGGAGRGYLPGPAREGDVGALIPENKGSWGWLPPLAFLLGPAPELELVLDTLSGRWRGSLSESGQDSPATFGPGGRRACTPLGP